MKTAEFNRIWEAEYLKARVDKITEAVENGNYESATDMLQMIQDKARMAENFIRQANINSYEKEKNKELSIIFNLEDSDIAYAIDVAKSAIYSNPPIVENIKFHNETIYSKGKGVSTAKKVINSPGYNELNSLLKIVNEPDEKSEELNIKKDVLWYGTYGQIEALCPNCSNEISDYEDKADERCPFCNQLINWNSERK